MGKEQNIATQERQGESINTGNLEAFHQIFAADVVEHDPAPDQANGPEGFIQFFKELRSAFPDLKLSVEHLVADEDSVAIAYTAEGTHKGNFAGIPASGHKVTWRGLQIARFKDARIVERWGSSDELGILKQIGAVKGTGSIDQNPAITGKQV